jgi:hypothetical protein
MPRDQLGKVRRLLSGIACVALVGIVELVHSGFVAACSRSAKEPTSRASGVLEVEKVFARGLVKKNVAAAVRSNSDLRFFVAPAGRQTSLQAAPESTSHEYHGNDHAT